MMPDDILRLFPSDTLADALFQAFCTGQYVIDWWEGDPRPGKDWEDDDYLSRGEYVRPRCNDDCAPLYNASWGSWGGSACTFLTEDGCSLLSDLRPYQCRMLEPKPNDKCIMHKEGTKHAIALAWLPYRDDLNIAANLYLKA